MCAGLLAALVGVVLIAAPADAGEKRVLRGTVGATGKARVTISFEVREQVRNRAVGFRFRRIEVRCDGDGQIRYASGPIAGSNSGPASQGKDFGVAALGQDYSWRVRGKVESPRKVRGTVRLHGSAVPLKGGGEADCDSGRLHFMATR
jgi:hypothetical protein